MSEKVTRKAAVQKRHRWLLALAIFLMVIFVSGQPLAAEAKDVKGTIQIGELERTYQVHVPDSIGAEAYPLVIVLHGAGGQGDRMPLYTGFSRLADSENFIVVYPDGYKKLWAVGWQEKQQKVDDVAFIRELIDCLVQEYPVDANRVYVSGMSMGAMLCHRLAVELPDRIAAIAPVAGTMPARLATMAPEGRMPVLMIHGTDDRIVPYAGGEVGPQQRRMQSGTLTANNLSVADTARYWAKANEGQLQPVTESTIDQIRDDGTRVIVDRYRAADGKNHVWVYTVEGGGHAWPRIGAHLEGAQESAVRRQGLIARSRIGAKRVGAPEPGSLLGKTSHEFDASDAIWQFFKPLTRE